MFLHKANSVTLHQYHVMLNNHVMIIGITMKFSAKENQDQPLN